MNGFVTQLNRNAPRVTNWVRRVLVRDLPKALALGWEECSREHTNVPSLSADETLVQCFGDNPLPWIGD